MVPYGILIRNVTTMTSSGELVECHPMLPLRGRSIKNNPGISQGHAEMCCKRTYGVVVQLLRKRRNTDTSTACYDAYTISRMDTEGIICYTIYKRSKL